MSGEESVAGLWTSLLLAARAHHKDRPSFLATAQEFASGLGADPKAAARFASAAALDLSRVLFAAGELRAAESISRYSIQAYKAIEVSPYHLLFLSELAKAENRWDDAWAYREDMATVMVSIEYASEPSLASLAADIYAIHANYEGLSAQLWMELGNLDLANPHLQRERQYSAKSNDPRLIARAVLRRMDWRMLREDFEGVDRIWSKVEPGAYPADQLALMRMTVGVARAKRSRDDINAVDGALTILGEVLESPDLSMIDRVTVGLSITEAHWRGGDISAADDTLSLVEGWMTDADWSPADISPTQHCALEQLRSQLAMARDDPDELVEQVERTETAYERMLADFARLPLQHGGVGFLHLSQRRSVLSTLIELRRRVDPDAAPQAGLRDLVRTHLVGTWSRSAMEAEPDFDRMLGQLAVESRGALVYLPSVDRTHLFLVDSDGVSLGPPLPSRDALRDVFRPLLTSLRRSWPKNRADATRHGKALLTHSRQAADALLPDLARRKLSEWESVTVIGSAMLDNLPFEALTLDEDRQLGQAIAIDQVSSLPLYVDRQAAAKVRAGLSAEHDLALLVELDPSGVSSSFKRSSKLVAIPFDRSDAEPLTSPFRDARTHLLLDAGPVTLKSHWDALADARIVHILAHGGYDSEKGAALLFDGGAIHASEIGDYLAPSGLVILSACGAAREQTRIGEDLPNHLGGALLRAGATCVVLSSVDIEYRSTMELMVHFHRGLAKGLSTAEAMRHARAKRAEEHGLSAAFHDALFQVLGAGHVAPIL